MKLRLTRYTPELLHALGSQTFPSLIRNALMRGVLFALIIQLLAYASSGRINGALQIGVLALIFSLFVFGFDLIEKYWAQSVLKKHR